MEMATTLTLAEMEELLAVHEQAEFNLDLDGTMATLIDNPRYELPGLGWYIEGQEAVRELYRRLLHAGDVHNLWADKRVHATSPSSLTREAWVYFDTPEGRTTGQYFVAMDFEGDKIAGERMYMCDRYAAMMGEALGADFGDIPGVQRMEDVAPPPAPRMDRAAVHAANSNH